MNTKKQRLQKSLQDDLQKDYKNHLHGKVFEVIACSQ